MIISFSDDLILLSHMLMSGSWHIYRPGEQWKRKRSHMRVVISTPKILAVAFNVPVAEFHTSASLVRRPGFNSLGPSVLAPQFNEVEAITRLRSRPELEIGVALLSQFLLSGIGNVFKSEICFMCGINPFRLVNSLTEDELQCLVSQARKFMLANVTVVRVRYLPTLQCAAQRIVPIPLNASGFIAARENRAAAAAAP